MPHVKRFKNEPELEKLIGRYNELHCQLAQPSSRKIPRVICDEMRGLGQKLAGYKQISINTEADIRRARHLRAAQELYDRAIVNIALLKPRYGSNKHKEDNARLFEYIKQAKKAGLDLGIPREDIQKKLNWAREQAKIV